MHKTELCLLRLMIYKHSSCLSQFNWYNTYLEVFFPTHHRVILITEIACPPLDIDSPCLLYYLPAGDKTTAEYPKIDTSKCVAWPVMNRNYTHPRKCITTKTQKNYVDR